MPNKVPITLTVNGRSRAAEVEPRTLLVHFLRETLNLTGTKIGCDTSQCGACVVKMNGNTMKSCTAFAVQADGADITTIEAWPRTANSPRSRKPSGTITDCSAATAPPA